MHLMKHWFAGIVLVLGVSTVGQAAPDLGLRDFNGKPVSLNSYVGKGKWTLVMFWALKCPICERNKPDIISFYKENKGKNAQVIGVVIDGMDKKKAIEAYLEKKPTGFPNYIAELGLMAINYQIAADETFRGTPTYWLFSPKGELLAVNPGPIRKEALEGYIASHS